MDAFVDHMIFVCFSFVAVGLILGIPCYLAEETKIGRKIVGYMVNFFVSYDEEDDDFED